MVKWQLELRQSPKTSHVSKLGEEWGAPCQNWCHWWASDLSQPYLKQWLLKCEPGPAAPTAPWCLSEKQSHWTRMQSWTQPPTGCACSPMSERQWSPKVLHCLPWQPRIRAETAAAAGQSAHPILEPCSSFLGAEGLEEGGVSTTHFCSQGARWRRE